MPVARRSPSKAVILATLACGLACNKEPVVDPNEVLPAGTAALDLASRPQLLFQVFGDKADAKLMPIAAVVGGTIRPIGLTRQGWRDLDSTYLAAGVKYPLYVNAEASGTVTITRGMWAGQAEPLYPLPGCRDLRPLASVTIDLAPRSDESAAEFLASSVPLKPHPPAPKTPLSADAVAAIGRAYGHALGLAAGMDSAELDSLDFVARMLVTGATKNPTLLVSFMDPQAGDAGAGQGHTSNVLALFDKADTGYVATYRHLKSGDAKTVEFQRVIDRMDADGDGIDELILESWHFAGTSELVVLRFMAQQWHEVLRAPSKWCLDPPATSGDRK